MRLDEQGRAGVLGEQIREGICHHGQHGTEPQGLLQELGSNGELLEGQGGSGVSAGKGSSSQMFVSPPTSDIEPTSFSGL